MRSFAVLLLLLAFCRPFEAALIKTPGGNLEVNPDQQLSGTVDHLFNATGLAINKTTPLQAVDVSGNIRVGGALILKQLASAPALLAGNGLLYVKASDKMLYYLNDAGEEKNLLVCSDNWLSLSGNLSTATSANLVLSQGLLNAGSRFTGPGNTLILLGNSCLLGASGTTPVFSGILGGANHTLSGNYSVIGSGNKNTLTGNHSVIVSGNSCSLSGNYSFFGTGTTMAMSGDYNAVSQGNKSLSLVSGNCNTLGAIGYASTGIIVSGNHNLFGANYYTAGFKIQGDYNVALCTIQNGGSGIGIYGSYSVYDGYTNTGNSVLGDGSLAFYPLQLSSAWASTNASLSFVVGSSNLAASATRTIALGNALSPVSATQRMSISQADTFFYLGGNATFGSNVATQLPNVSGNLRVTSALVLPNSSSIPAAGWSGNGLFYVNASDSLLWFTDDTGADTGLSLADNWSLSSQGNLTLAGNLGLGTATPAARLDLYGEALASANLYGGNLLTGNASTSLSIAGNVLPSANGQYDLGSAAKNWREIWALHLKLVSDGRKKERVETLAGADELQNLEPVRYRYRSEPGRERVGFLAQDAEAVRPELVERSGDGPLHLRPLAVLPLIVAGLKNRQAGLEAREASLAQKSARADELEARLRLLRARVNALEKEAGP